MKMKNWIKWTNKMSKNLRKNSNANVLQIAFAFHIVSDNVKGKPKWSRKSSYNVSEIPLTLWSTNLNEDVYCDS